ncbi:uncharacterized protein B0T23DRAFT_408838 [Neurospora hispaniola]|uniref:Uncharacterized protein n=1 Tax=Neurospora hispaniola TaxID=588809 RepID=A0AAJ0HYE8_9PEZI|nr:hypothetical protein B0T23DRAFT_408838 [Neurospora hispaniola]
MAPDNLDPYLQFPDGNDLGDFGDEDFLQLLAGNEVGPIPPNNDDFGVNLNPVDNQPMPNPMGGEVAQLPLNEVVGDAPMNEAAGQIPVDGEFAPHPTETIVQMDNVMAGVVGTELHDPYWKILDSIYYFIRNHRWASIPNVQGKFRSRASVQASHRAVGAPPPYVPANWAAYEAMTSAPGNEDIGQLFRNHLLFAFDAFRWAVFMERFGALEVSYGNIGQTRPIIATLHPKLAVHEKQGIDWDAHKQEHGDVDQHFEELSIKNEPESLAAQEWKRRQKAYQVRTKYGFSQGSFADAPRTQEQEQEVVSELVVAMLNDHDIVDKEQHKGGRENHVLKEKKHMSLLNVESSAWEALRALQDVSLGMPNAGVFSLDFVFKPYDSFGARLADLKTFFHSSKAALTSTTESSKLTRFAGRPSAELSSKRINKTGAERKAADLTIASEVRRNMAAAAQPQNTAYEASEQVWAEDSMSELDHEVDAEDDQTLYGNDAQGGALATVDEATVDDNTTYPGRMLSRYIRRPFVSGGFEANLTSHGKAGIDWQGKKHGSVSKCIIDQREFHYRTRNDDVEVIRRFVCPEQSKKLRSRSAESGKGSSMFMVWCLTDDGQPPRAPTHKRCTTSSCFLFISTITLDLFQQSLTSGLTSSSSPRFGPRNLTLPLAQHPSIHPLAAVPPGSGAPSPPTSRPLPLRRTRQANIRTTKRNGGDQGSRHPRNVRTTTWPSESRSFSGRATAPVERRTTGWWFWGILIIAVVRRREESEVKRPWWGSTLDNLDQV